MSVILPINPSPSQATVGKDYLLYVNTGTPTVPVWTLIGGQRAGTLSRKADSIDASNKTTGGWKSTLIGLLSWSIALDGLVMLADAGLQALEQAFDAAQEIQVQFVYPDLTFRTGWGSITELTIDNQYNQAATLKGTIEGVGALSDLVPSISPASTTTSISTGANLSFAIAPTNTVITSVSNGATVLATTSYSYASGVLVINQTYLATLAVGTVELSILTGNGTTITIAVILTA